MKVKMKCIYFVPDIIDHIATGQFGDRPYYVATR